MNDPVLLGAPNVVRGRSQSGNVSATALVAEGLCDALVSDYYYPAMARAAWRLVDQEFRDLPSAWAMISATPAVILGLADPGRLDHGLRADGVAVNSETRAIEMTICGGVLTHLSHGAARRFAGASAAMDMAAE